MNNALFHLKHLKRQPGLLKAGPTGNIKQGTEVVQVGHTSNAVLRNPAAASSVRHRGPGEEGTLSCSKHKVGWRDV